MPREIDYKKIEFQEMQSNLAFQKYKQNCLEEEYDYFTAVVPNVTLDGIPLDGHSLHREYFFN